MSDIDTQVHFGMEKGKRDSDRLVEDCFAGLISMLHDKHIQVDGKLYRIKVISEPNSDKVMFDILDLPGFDHVEFCIKKTGWGRFV